MKQRKNRSQRNNLTGLLAAVLLLSVLWGCNPVNDASVSAARPTKEAEGISTPLVSSMPSPTLLDERPYTGDGSTYTYITTEGRDREWEEDIVYFANTFLDTYTGHPKLVDRGCTLRYTNELRNGYWEGMVLYESLYDPALREAFIGRINELLLSIEKASDDALLFGAAEAAALLHDAHTNLLQAISMGTEMFPLWLIPIYTPDGTPQAYIIGAPKGSEDLLLCRLDAINGFPVAEILEKAGQFISHESMTRVQTIMFDTSNDFPRLLHVRILRYLGVMGEEDTALFTLTDEAGTTREAALSWVKFDDLPNMDIWRSSAEAHESTSIDLMYSDVEHPVWHRFLDEGKTLYIRLLQCSDDMDRKVKEAVVAAEKAGGVEKMILDFRGNGGGTIPSNVDIVRSINSLDAPGGKYVLIDGGCFSAAVLHPACLRRFCEGVTLVGAPAGEPPNGVFCRGGYYTSPHKRITWTISPRECNYDWPENDDPALTPDILVYQTLEDYKNGIDTVLNYVLQDSAE